MPENEAPVTDTPEENVAPPVDTAPPPVVDYEQRYTNLRPEYDRKSQRLAELEAEREQWLASQQPQEPEYEDDEYDYEDTVARHEIAQLKALLSKQQEETQHQQAVEREQAFINSEIKVLEAEQEEEFSDDEWNTLGILAERYRTEGGEPDIKVAYEQLFGKIVKPRREKYVSTKKASRPRSGSPAAQSIDLDDPDARKEYMAQKLAELEDQND